VACLGSNGLYGLWAGCRGSDYLVASYNDDLVGTAARRHWVVVAAFRLPKVRPMVAGKGHPLVTTVDVRLELRLRILLRRLQNSTLEFRLLFHRQIERWNE